MDGLLFALLIFLMCFKIFPRRYHEAMGVVVILLILLHLWWNRNCFSSLRKGKRNTFHNEQYIKDAFKKGYVPVDEASRAWLVSKKILTPEPPMGA